MRYVWLSMAAVMPAAMPARAEEPFALKDGETVVFYGDSITENGLYVRYVEAYLRTRFPEKRFRVLNRGISSETLSGTSEPDHDPRRPCALDRFARDIAPADPDVLVVCFGMNDGNYFPFDAERFARYQAGVRRLIEIARTETRARILLLTPPTYDAYRRQVLNPNATAYGYQYPAIDYDATLGRYAAWLLTLRTDDVSVADLHTAMNEHLRRRREGQVSFSLQDDGIHPGPTGHWLMAQTVLAAWNAPAICAEVRVDAGRMRVLAGNVEGLRRDGTAIGFTWRAPVPMPMDPRWDGRSLAIEQVRDRFNRYTLAVTGLAPGRYRLTADGQDIFVNGHDEYAKGIDLLDHPLPTVRAAAVVWSLVEKRERLEYGEFRKRAARPTTAGAVPADDLATTRPAQLPGECDPAALEMMLRRECQPRVMQIRLEPTAREQGN